ncbi:translation initiation factor IF-3 [Roseibium denhamense]|uniref:Translation initiation factor IF-3 n=1 Tax=Roseibium denhamense TaxID=76305 RepID=A0ABY1P7J5_9HYPH|nr:translation initiation factor IF-3 [Roseibium denhamense]SMP28350.1 hypothetical protein SAMN06265374_2907 [Roseibium denhamense]
MNGSRLVFQLLKIVVGFVSALVLCSLFLTWGFFQWDLPEDHPAVWGAITGTGLVTASVIGSVVAVPAGLVILLAELFRVRSLLVYLAGAGLMAFGLWTLGAGDSQTGLRPGTSVALAAGFVAGAVYWGIAGRTAGSWRARPASGARETNAD